jgi:hypothetical protein
MNLDYSSNYSAHVIVPELKLILCYFQGKVKISDLIQLNLAFINDKEFNPDFNILMDFRSSTAIAFGIEMKEFYTLLKQAVKLNKIVKNGILVNTPNQKYLANIFKPLAKLNKIDAQDFLYLKDCLIWMGYSELEQVTIKDALSNLMLIQ